MGGKFYSCHCLIEVEEMFHNRSIMSKYPSILCLLFIIDNYRDIDAYLLLTNKNKLKTSRSQEIGVPQSNIMASLSNNNVLLILFIVNILGVTVDALILFHYCQLLLHQATESIIYWPENPID